MYATPTVAARGPRASQPAADGGVAKKGAAFDLVAAEHAELEREREILETMIQAQLKFEDEIVKKWIALID
jgi:hypothetical protein